jgi:hypothetical protein
VLAVAFFFVGCGAVLAVAEASVGFIAVGSAGLIATISTLPEVVTRGSTASSSVSCMPGGKTPSDIILLTVLA